MDSEFVKWLTTLGVGGVLAAFMFHFYRKDVKQYTDLWREQTAMLLVVVKENTASNTRLVSSVDSLQVITAQLMAMMSERGLGRRHSEQVRDPRDLS
jgi:phosphate/sulfate permease